MRAKMHTFCQGESRHGHSAVSQGKTRCFSGCSVELYPTYEQIGASAQDSDTQKHKEDWISQPYRIVSHKTEASYRKDQDAVS